MMDVMALVPFGVLGLMVGGVLFGLKRAAAARALRDQAVRDWAARNNFRCEVDPASDVRFRVSGEEEVPFVLEVRNPNEKRTGEKPGTEWVARDLTSEQLELILVSKPMVDFFHGPFGQLMLNLVGKAAPSHGFGSAIWLERLRAMRDFPTAPTTLMSGRFVAIAREPEKWAEVISREVERLLDAWPETPNNPFHSPMVVLDRLGLQVEVGLALEDPQKLHHLIRIGAAAARMTRASESSSLD